MLYIVGTPIGNLGDISPRALEILRDADFIAAEDTRVTRKLLSHLGVKKTLVSYYEFNRHESGEKIVHRILDGESCALVTDAGTPGVSDPGEDLVTLCAESGMQMIAIPGPCAAVAALVLSGLATSRFTFEGFLSTARKSRFERLNSLKAEKRTMVFYEAPHKLIRTLNDMLAVFGDRRVSISRELTKIYEETLRFTLSEAICHFGSKPPRGEFVLIVEGQEASPNPEELPEEAIAAAVRYINSGQSLKDAVKTAAEEYSVSKNALYNAVIRY
jgi:16S rRNA (cytidine1402-2'-O)-methyltransferase